MRRKVSSLRWSEGAIVIDIDIQKEHMVISFKNGKVITISNEVEMDNSWIIKKAGFNEANSAWLAVCDSDGEIFINTPNR
jgi:frataxin-like iron-binding protein CyaY